MDGNTMASKGNGNGRKAYDWEAIERDYRAGQLSNRELGRKHGPSHVAIGKRAKRDGWTKDLAKRVRDEVTTALVTGEVTTPHADAREIVKQAAAQGVEIVLSHRTDIAALREKLEALIKRATEAAEVESLSRTLKNLVALERQAFNLDADGESAIPPQEHTERDFDFDGFVSSIIDRHSEAEGAGIVSDGDSQSVDTTRAVDAAGGSADA